MPFQRLIPTPRGKLDGLLQDSFRQGHYMLQIVRADFPFGQMLIRLLQIPPEIDGSVSVDLRIHQLDFIQNVAYLRMRQRGMRQILDEIIEGVLEVDIVFPQRIVRIEN